MTPFCLRAWSRSLSRFELKALSRNVKDLRHGLDPLKKLHAALHIFHSRVIVAFGIAHLRSLLKFLCSRTQFEARTVGAKEKKAWLQQCMTLLSAFTCDFSRQHNRNPAAIALRSARNPALFGLDFTDAECKTSLGGLVCQAFFRSAETAPGARVSQLLVLWCDLERC